MDPLNLRAYAHQHNTPIISTATEAYLTKLVQELKPQYILEIGTAIGCSTQLFAELLAKRDGELVSFEISHPSYQVARLQQHFHQYYHSTLYRHDFLHVDLNKIVKRPIDFVFVDGMKADYLNYYLQVLPFCHDSTTIVCDDVRQFADKVSPLIHYLDQQHIPYQHISLDDDDLLLLQNSNLSV